MINRRCFSCKCLQQESTRGFFIRTKIDPKAKFYCRKCKSKITSLKKSNLLACLDNPRGLPICHEKFIEEKNKRRRFLRTPKAYAKKIRSKKELKIFLSHEESIAMGRFIRKCPLCCTVDYIIPLLDGGRKEFSNLKYSAKDKSLKKSAIKITENTKNEIYTTCPFTPMREEVRKIEVTNEKTNRVSKYNRLRMLA